MTEKEQNALIEDMNLGKQQRMFFSEDMSFSISIVTGMSRAGRHDLSVCLSSDL